MTDKASEKASEKAMAEAERLYRESAGHILYGAVDGIARALDDFAGVPDPQPGELAAARRQIESDRDSFIKAVGHAQKVEMFHAAAHRVADSYKVTSPESALHDKVYLMGQKLEKAEASLAQALLVLKALDIRHEARDEDSLNALHAMTHWAEDPETIDSFEALRKAGKL